MEYNRTPGITTSGSSKLNAESFRELLDIDWTPAFNSVESDQSSRRQQVEMLTYCLLKFPIANKGRFTIREVLGDRGVVLQARLQAESVVANSIALFAMRQGKGIDKA